MNSTKKPFARQRILITRLVVWPLGVLIIITRSAWESSPPFDGIIFFAGCISAGIASIGRLWCLLYICGRKTRELVTLGPYSLCRNPLYLFSAVGAVGVALATETLSVPALTVLLFAISYPSVIRSEEAKLATLHGDEYADYVSRTPQFLPRFSQYDEPDVYEVHPAKFRHAMLDALWFVWLIGILELAEALRQAGLLPVVLDLY
jgi:protein-S-isoprenylcysteine O-methyltransferase Ste14